MKQAFRSGVAVAVILLVVAIVVSPFVDLPLTTTRAWDRLLISGLALAVAASGVATTCSSLFMPVGRWKRRPSQHSPEEYRGDLLDLIVVWLC